MSTNYLLFILLIPITLVYEIDLKYKFGMTDYDKFAKKHGNEIFHKAHLNLVVYAHIATTLLSI